MPSGGYRKPSSPAPVSGPGAHSRRTDGQPMRDLPNADYGENATFRELQGGAPLASTAAGSPANAVDPAVAAEQVLSQLTGLGEPSLDPNQPVTAGAAAGAGPGMEALGLPMTDLDERKADARALGPYLPAMIAAASQRGAAPSFKRFVRRLIADQR